MLLDFKLYMFSKLYGFLYQINIAKNSTVIVQQQWIRKEFFQRFGCESILVAHPEQGGRAVEVVGIKRTGRKFFYPSIPRFYKNFEVLLEAWQRLCAIPGWDGELVVTVDESSGDYGRALMKKFGGLNGVVYAGRLTREQVQHIYSQSDCLVFPSKIETWGLPITEAKQAGLAVFVADEPYAREAVGGYPAAEFFPANDSAALASLMKRFRDGLLNFDVGQNEIVIDEPYAPNWKSLFEYIQSVRS